MPNLNKIFERHRTAALAEPKPVEWQCVKMMEEAGELAAELLIDSEHKAVHKSPGADGVKGEVADVIQVAMCIFYNIGGTTEEFEEIFEQKLLKWEKCIRARKERLQKIVEKKRLTFYNNGALWKIIKILKLSTRQKNHGIKT